MQFLISYVQFDNLFNYLLRLMQSIGLMIGVISTIEHKNPAITI